MPTPNEELAEAITRHRLWLLRFEAGAVKDATAAYAQATAPARATLQGYQRQVANGEPLTAAQVREAEKLRTQLEKAIRTARGTIQDGLQGRLLEAVRTEARVVPDLLSEALPPGREAKAVPLADLAELLRVPFGGQTYAARIDVALLQVRDRVDAGLAAAVEQGAGTQRAASMLGEAIGELEGGRARLVRIARTEIQRVANGAAQRTYAANRDVLKGVTYLATFDSRTCEICEPLHDQTFEMDPETGRHDGPPLPQHPMCRCFYAPLSKSWEEIGLAGGE